MKRTRILRILRFFTLVMLLIVGALVWLLIKNPDIVSDVKVLEDLLTKTKNLPEAASGISEQIVESLKSTPVVYTSDDGTMSSGVTAPPVGEKPVIGDLTPRGMEVIQDKEEELTPEVLPFIPEVWAEPISFTDLPSTCAFFFEAT